MFICKNERTSMPSKELSLKQLKEKVEQFINERDWQQFHTPKNLSMNLSIEAAELMELFLWCKSEDSLTVYKDKKQDAQDEVADILFGLLCFCNTTGINLEQSFLSKFKKIAQKYPIDKSKGKSLKYTEL